MKEKTQSVNIFFVGLYFSTLLGFYGSSNVPTTKLMSEVKKVRTYHGKFQRWVDQSGGNKAVASLIDCTDVVVSYWYRRKGNPSVAYMKRLIVASDFELSFDTIINDTDPNPIKKA